MGKKNLLIFIENNTNDDEDTVQDKLVRLYMNRFVVEEDTQFEIHGVYRLDESDSQIVSRNIKQIKNQSTENERNND